MIVYGRACSLSELQWTIEILTSFLLSMSLLSHAIPSLIQGVMLTLPQSLVSLFQVLWLFFFTSPLLTWCPYINFSNILSPYAC